MREPAGGAGSANRRRRQPGPRAPGTGQVQHPERELGGEQGVEPAGVHPGHLGDPAQPVAHGVLVHAQRLGGRADLGPGGEVGPQRTEQVAASRGRRPRRPPAAPPWRPGPPRARPRRRRTSAAGPPGPGHREAGGAGPPRRARSPRAAPRTRAAARARAVRRSAPVGSVRSGGSGGSGGSGVAKRTHRPADLPALTMRELRHTVTSLTTVRQVRADEPRRGGRLTCRSECSWCSRTGTRT
jgi:hypothetical protein